MPVRFVAAIVVVCGMSFFVGCATLPRDLALELDTAEIPRTVELTRVPFFPQERYQCGPAALATLVSFAGRSADPAVLAEQVFVPARRGSFQLELIATARATSLLIYPLTPSIAEIFREVAQGNPVLVLQNLGLKWLPQWHYAVLVGYDLDNEVVILRSGVTHRLEVPLPTFVATWRRAGSWAIVALSPSSVPITASPEKYFQAVNALERLGDLEAARLAYNAATRKWPNDSKAWFLAGNSAYILGDAVDAEYALRRATQIAPYVPLFWNNLAYAVEARGCGRLASVAAECALRLAPDVAIIQDTHHKLRFLTSTVEARCADLTCPR